MKTEVLESGVSLVAGMLHWELLARSRIYPVQIEREGGLFEVYFRMKDLDNEDAKQLRREMSISGDAVYKDMFDGHFICMEGVEGTLASQKAYVDSLPKLKQFVCEESFLGVVDVPEIIGAADLDKPYSLRLEQRLYDGNEVITVAMRHVLEVRPENMTAFQQGFKETGEAAVVVDLEEIERIYDEDIRSVEGYSMDGVSCRTLDKQAYVHLIPFVHKFSVVDEAYHGAEVK